MLNIIPIKADNIVGFHIEGKIDSEDIERAIATTEDKLKRHDKLRVYAEVEDIEGISLEALLKDLQYAFSRFNKFEKEAVICDINWIQTLTELGGKLVPSIEVRHFSFAERERGRTWIES